MRTTIPLLLLAAALAVSAAASSTVAATPPHTPAAKARPTFLYVLQARAGWAEQRPNGHWRLTLNDVSPSVLEFSDRPARIAKDIPAHQFVSDWKRLFTNSPPNASLIVQHAPPGAAPTAVELFKAAWEKPGQLSLCMCTIGTHPTTAQWLKTMTRTSARRHGEITLFIDNAGSLSGWPSFECPPQPDSLCGRLDLSDTYLWGANLTGADLFRSILAEAHLGQVNLADANLSHADFSQAYLQQANLSGANLTYANFTEAMVTDANLHDANLSHAELADAALDDNLTGADLSYADLTGASLASDDLTGADLTGANLTDTNLAGTNLTGADLADTNLTEDDLTDANLTGTNLSGAILCRTTLPGTPVDNSGCPQNP